MKKVFRQIFRVMYRNRVRRFQVLVCRHQAGDEAGAASAQAFPSGA